MAEVHRTTLVPGKLELLTTWLPQQRWYAAKGSTPSLRRVGGYRLDDPAGEVGIEVLIVADDQPARDGQVHTTYYQVPLTYRGHPLGGAEGALVGTTEHGVLGHRYVYDGCHDPVAMTQLFELVQGRAQAQAQSESDTPDLRFTGHTSTPMAVRVWASRVLRGEQSNTSVICETRDERGNPAATVIVKLFRMLHHGQNPDVVLQSALSEAGSTRVPRSIGSVSGPWRDEQPDGRSGGGRELHGQLAFAQEFLPGVEDAWRVALRAAEAGTDFTTQARDLGVATAQIHLTLADALGTSPASEQARAALTRSLRDRLDAAVQAHPALAEHRDALVAATDLSGLDWPALQRIHGDYHLGQVLLTQDRGWVAVDFEGEPLRPLSERTQRDLALRDVAGMLRSFDYAAGSVGEQASEWARSCRQAFLDGWTEVVAPASMPDAGSVADAGSVQDNASVQDSSSAQDNSAAPHEPSERHENSGQHEGAAHPSLLPDEALTRALELDKALYEVVYEARNRPTWVHIPVAAVFRLLALATGNSPGKETSMTNEDARAAVEQMAERTEETPLAQVVHTPGPNLEPQEHPASRAALPSATVADESAITAFVQSRHSQPHDLLGHHVGPGGLTITAYRPLARSVQAKLADGAVLDLQHVRDGIWTVTDPGHSSTQDYRLLVAWEDGIEHEQDDPYRFAPTLGELDRYLIAEGRHEQLWTVLGSHVRTYSGPMGEVTGVAFAVWAPNASSVHVVGDFNGWDRTSLPMRVLEPQGIWELFVPGAHEGQAYQFAVRGPDGTVTLKADPMARYAEVAPKQASIVHETHYDWSDDAWREHRRTTDPHNGPMSIYELHLGSWREGQSYAELAEHLVNYVKDLGFTHVELMPVMEHPFVPSWGYHVTGYYAVSSRWGTPDEFRYLVDRLHQEGIGVILDWVPGHFATDPWALARFDGTPTYEHPDPRKGWHKEWGSFIFDFGRPEVRNFLVANAIYWLEEFHVDALRVDGVASMLYLDYSRGPGEWVPNVYGGRENLDAVQLLQETNATTYKRVPGIFTVAEESTSWPGVTKPTDGGGLGFGYKWNMGWMNDTLRYLSTEPIFRRYHQGNLTFALVYQWSESFILPISHDEVVHGKGSLLRKMPGNREEQVAQVRAFLAHMWAHPGKQLLFMGSEFGQESEWSESRSLDWWVLDQPMHYRIHNEVKDLNRLYKTHKALWELDASPDGFEWLSADDADHNTISYLRWGKGERAVDAPVVAVVTNFSGSTHERYRIGLPRGGDWQVVMDTAGYFPDAPSSTGRVLPAQDTSWNGQPCSVELVVPAFSTVWVVPADEVEGDAPADELDAIASTSPERSPKRSDDKEH